MSDSETLSAYVARHAQRQDVGDRAHAMLRYALSESYVLVAEGRRFLRRLTRLLSDRGLDQPWRLPDGIDTRVDAFKSDALIVLCMDSSVHVRWHHEAPDTGEAPGRARWSEAIFVGGAVLGLDALQRVPGSGSFTLKSASPLSFYLIPQEVLATLDPERRQRLGGHLRAETAAAMSPSLQHIVARQRARFAAAATEVTYDALDAPVVQRDGKAWKVLSDYDTRADALYLIGRQGGARISRRWRLDSEPAEHAEAWHPRLKLDHRTQRLSLRGKPMGSGTAHSDAALQLRQAIRAPLYGDVWLPTVEEEFHYSLSFGDVLGVDALEHVSIIRERVLIAEGTRLFRITAAELQRLYQVFGLQLLAGALQALVGLFRRLPVLIAAARRRDVLRDERPGALALALVGSQLLQWRVGNSAPPPLGDASGACFVLDGELLGYRSFFSDVDDESRLLGAEFERLRVHAKGDCFGIAGLGRTAPFVESLRARVPTWLAFVSEARMINTLSAGITEQIDRLVKEARHSSRRRAWERAMLDATDDDEGHFEVGPEARALLGSADGYAYGDSRPIVLFHTVGRPQPGTPPADGLIEALAREVEAQFDEPCLMVTMQSWGKGIPPVAARRIGGLSVRLDLDIQEAMPTSEDRRWRWLLDVLDHMGELSSVNGGYIFLQVVDNTPLSERLRVLVDRVVYLSDASYTPRPPDGPATAPYVYTVIRPGVPGNAARIEGVRQHRYLPSTVRLGIIGGAPEPACLARWARAVTNRRVGLALGGGGAWGMAHVAVLRAIHHAGVPIDIISGSSVGASVGAFYCALGLEGLDLFIQRRMLLQAATLAGMVTSTAFVAAIAHLIGDVLLEEMALPFFPVSTDLNTGSEAPVLAGPAAFAARKSGSLAPVYPATPTREGTYVDGGISRNVPVSLLETEGARLIVASNIVPPPAFQSPRQPRFSGRLGRVLSDLSPTRRGEATLKSALTLFYNAGTSPAEDAAVSFESQWTGVIPLDLWQGARLIDDVQSTPAFWQTVTGLKDRWERLKRANRESRRDG